jgi:transposase
MRRTGLSKPSVWRWQERYLEAGVDGLVRDKTRPSRMPALSSAKVAEVIRRTLEEAPPGAATHWTVRTMAAASGISPAKVQEIWQEAGLAPHRVRRFKLSTDPAFAEKLEDVVKVIHVILDNYAAQAPERPQMAGPASALGVPLHADLMLVAERGRRLLRQADPTPSQARRLPLAGGPPRGDQPLHRAPQPRSPTVHLEGRS